MYKVKLDGMYPYISNQEQGIHCEDVFNAFLIRDVLNHDENNLSIDDDTDTLNERFTTITEEQTILIKQQQKKSKSFKAFKQMKYLPNDINATRLSAMSLS